MLHTLPPLISYGSAGSVSHAFGSCRANHRPCCIPTEPPHWRLYATASGQREWCQRSYELYISLQGKEKKVNVVGLSKGVRVSTWDNIPDMANPPNLSISIYVPPLSPSLPVSTQKCACKHKHPLCLSTVVFSRWMEKLVLMWASLKWIEPQ